MPYFIDSRILLPFCSIYSLKSNQVHDDADEEDLEVHEVEEALALYRHRLSFERFERKCRSRYVRACQDYTFAHFAAL
jgi:hypothetical protein